MLAVTDEVRIGGGPVLRRGAAVYVDAESELALAADGLCAIASVGV